MHIAQSSYSSVVVSRQPSPRIRELIRQGAWIALNPSQEWLAEFDRATVAAHPGLAEDPGLAKTVSRSNRTNLYRFTVAHLRDPGAPVDTNVGGEPLRMARELRHRGLDTAAPAIYRIGLNMALRRWTDIVFQLSSEREELRELLDVVSRSANEYLDATLGGISQQLQLEHDELTRDACIERRNLVEAILDGGPMNGQQAEARLGYPLHSGHTAAVIWCDEDGGDHGQLDRAADAFGAAVECAHSLVVTPNDAARWVWVKDVAAFDGDQIKPVFDGTSTMRIAIGTNARGVEGFRRSHQEALSAQQTLVRLGSLQPIAFFDAIHMVALLTQNRESADDFINATLGDFASASPVLQTTLLTYINEHCNAVRAAQRLFIHRNTLLYRLETAQKLLPRPLDHTVVRVAVALEALQWRGNQSAHSSSSAASTSSDKSTFV
jgi:DNA-binding PucR family transcriptional regulator